MNSVGQKGSQRLSFMKLLQAYEQKCKVIIIEITETLENNLYELCRKKPTVLVIVDQGNKK